MDVTVYCDDAGVSCTRGRGSNWSRVGDACIQAQFFDKGVRAAYPSSVTCNSEGNEATSRENQLIAAFSVRLRLCTEWLRIQYAHEKPPQGCLGYLLKEGHNHLCNRTASSCAQPTMMSLNDTTTSARVVRLRLVPVREQSCYGCALGCPYGIIAVLNVGS
jgi:hypothetical protein